MNSLSTGQIAGIIVGIVVVSLILLALLIWRFISFRTNRDFFTGRRMNLPRKLQRQTGHIRSTRRQTFDVYGNGDQYGDEKRLVDRTDQPYDNNDETMAEHEEVDLNEGSYGHSAPGHKTYSLNDTEEMLEPTAGPSATKQQSNASPARQSRWWPYGQANSIKDASSSRGRLPTNSSGDALSRSGASNPTASRSMLGHEEDVTLPVGNSQHFASSHSHGQALSRSDHEWVVDEQVQPKRRSAVRGSYRQGCTTQ